MTDQLTREAIRYLGYGRHAVDEQTKMLIAGSFEKLQRAAGKRSVYRIFALNQMDDGGLSFGNITVHSKSLTRNLRGCDKIVVFGATLGIGVDHLIRRTSLVNMAEAVTMQACAAALLEEYCDMIQDNIGREMEAEGRYLRPRFSPGYGDFSIEHQPDLIRLLDCAKKIGLTLTESCMMTPTKSVTAVMGASQLQENCHRKGCEACGKTDCIYRRDTA